MKAIQIDVVAPDLERAIQNLKIVEVPIPKPGPGEVLIKTGATTCNPSDLVFLLGVYGVKLALPTVPGFEGMGTVVASGGGALGWWLKGKRVAVALSGRSGTWAEYIIAKTKECFPLKHTTSDQQGATLLINSLTAVAMIDQVKKEGHKAIIFNAARSQVGNKLRDLSSLQKIPFINIVRNQEQVDQLKKEGEKWVVSSSDEQFLHHLSEMARSLHATIAFDAVAGEQTGKILSAMPPKSVIVVYGALAGQSCREISPKDLIFGQKKVEGFWLVPWGEQNGFFKTYKSLRYIEGLIKQGQGCSQIRATSGFEGWKELLLSYAHKQSEGKVILSPSSE